MSFWLMNIAVLMISGVACTFLHLLRLEIEALQSLCYVFYTPCLTVPSSTLGYFCTLNFEYSLLTTRSKIQTVAAH